MFNFIRWPLQLGFSSLHFALYEGFTQNACYSEVFMTSVASASRRLYAEAIPIADRRKSTVASTPRIPPFQIHRRIKQHTTDDDALLVYHAWLSSPLEPMSDFRSQLAVWFRYESWLTAPNAPWFPKVHRQFVPGLTGSYGRAKITADSTINSALHKWKCNPIDGSLTVDVPRVGMKISSSCQNSRLRSHKADPASSVSLQHFTPMR